MKKRKHLIFVVLLLISASAFSQDFKKFRVGMGLGFAAPSKGYAGALVYLEPGWRVNDRILAGLRFEGSIMLGNSASAIGSYLLTGQYYFSNGGVRPFAGLGVGFYSASNTGTYCDCGINKASRLLGFAPRVGFDTRHFVLALELNAVSGSPAVKGISPNDTSSPLNLNYLSLKFGVSIGGGRKNTSD